MIKKFKRQFGGRLTPELKTRYEASPRWNGKAFENPVETKIDFNLADISKMLHERFCQNKRREPKGDLACAPFTSDILEHIGTESKLIWYGHSAMLLRLAGYTILLDPMMGDNASPIAPFKTRRFTGELLHILESIPHVDVVLMTHDHYDHLDMRSMDILMPKTDRFVTALGVGRHLEAWGCEASRIQEVDWWDRVELEGLQLTFTPSRHSSGRAVRDQSCTLWGGWVFETDSEKIYFSGDGGYGEHFKEIGERLGPFDLGLMECGQYNEKWRVIHLHPEESVQAALDAGVKKAVPVHWAGFALAMHDWDEPAIRFAAEADRLGLEHVFPRIGETFDLGLLSKECWWNPTD